MLTKQTARANIVLGLILTLVAVLIVAVVILIGEIVVNV